MTHYPPALKKTGKNATGLTADGASEWKGREAEILADLARAKVVFQLRTICAILDAPLCATPSPRTQIEGEK